MGKKGRDAHGKRVGPASPVQNPVAASVIQESVATPFPRPSVDEKSQLKVLIEALEQLRGTRVIVYWLADQAKISEAAVVPLYDQLRAIGRQPKIDLLLYTRGGDTEAPWRFVTLIREFCDDFAVLVPYVNHRSIKATYFRFGVGHVDECGASSKIAFYGLSAPVKSGGG